MEPKDLLQELGISPGDIVADFGCGPGYFSIPAAEAVGEEGMVYAFDILPDALEVLTSKAKTHSGSMNITARRTNLEKENATKLQDASVDSVILKDVLFQNEDKGAIMKEACRILKSGGRALVVEWNEKQEALGPEQKMRVPQKKIEELIARNHLSIVKNFSAGNYHSAYILRKN